MVQHRAVFVNITAAKCKYILHLFILNTLFGFKVTLSFNFSSSSALDLDYVKLFVVS